MKDRFAAPSFFVTVIGAVIAYLSLAHDTKAWPYQGPTWIWIGVGAVSALAGLILIAYKQNRSTHTRWSLTLGLTCVLVGAIVGTAAAVNTHSRQPLDTRHEVPHARITSVRDGQMVDNTVRIAGVIDQPVRPGESLWLFIGTLPPSSDEPTAFYLQFGPCGVLSDTRTWECNDITLATQDPRRVRFYLVGVRGNSASEFVQRLASGAVLDYQKNNALTPDRTDARHFDKLPAGDDILPLDTVTVGTHR